MRSIGGLAMKRHQRISRDDKPGRSSSFRRRFAFSPRVENLEQRQLMAVDVILEWNDIMLQANANDHTSSALEQAGPIKTSQAFATVSGAMYDAYNSVERIGDELETTAKRGRGADATAAVAQAAHDTLVSLYPSQKPLFDTALRETLARVEDGKDESEGRRIGAEVAFAILRSRSKAGVDSLNDPGYQPNGRVGFHNVDPLHPNQGFYASGAADIDGFVVKNTSRFAVPDLDDGSLAGRAGFLQSERYTQAYNEVLALGGDGITTPTVRTEEQTQIGKFWAYDGRPGLGTPPRLYNQIVRTIAEQEGNTEAENARLFALVNVAMADAGVAAWDTKYDDDLWRPILGIRSGEIDGNENTIGVSDWTPLGGPASNPTPGETNFTPNFPSYVSGHATFGAATFEMLENFYGRDQISFSFVSDELNGQTIDADGSVRPLVERSFDSLTEAKLENGQSRIYLGIHWAIDSEAGIEIGDSVADYVFANAMKAKTSDAKDPWNKPDSRVRHNGFDPEDVDDDGHLSALDALMLVNAINTRNDSGPRSGFKDVDHDGSLSPLDVLQVVNRLNANSNSDGNFHASSRSNRPSQDTKGIGVRSYDGTGNNIANPEWGSTGEQLLRVADSDYGDGISTPAGADRPSARVISNELSDHVEEATPNDRDLSAYIYVWGQFLDHDLSKTEAASPRERFNITVPTGDTDFDPASSGSKSIPFGRSEYDLNTGTTASNPREQITQVSSWIDGSMIYGSDATTAAILRSFVGGRMKSQSTELGEMLPLNTDNLPMDNASPLVEPNELFAAGDTRANENVELTAMQTLFVREHNRIASEAAKKNPTWSDEQIYQHARSIVIAEVQAITYNQWLPALIGSHAVSTYKGYNPKIDPSIANEFSTASYRLHTSINDDVEFFDDSGRPQSFTYINEAGETVAVDGGVPLSEAFFNPTLFKQTGVDGILKYAGSTKAEEIDTQLVESLRNFLFGAPGQGGLDLAALNIQRGRDHGLADYNSIRVAYGLPKVTSFAQITSDIDLQSKMEKLFGSVDNIDAWVGMLAEDHVRGSSVGITSQRIIADQFERLRDGDRFWFERVFSGRQLAELQRTTLEDVIERNTGITSLQENVFFFSASITGTVYNDQNTNGSQDRREQALQQIQVELLNDVGEVIETARTDRSGRYRLTEIPETGDFQVRVVLPAGTMATTPEVQNVHVVSGNIELKNRNFGLKMLSTTPTPNTPPVNTPRVNPNPNRPGDGPQRPSVPGGNIRGTQASTNGAPASGMGASNPSIDLDSIDKEKAERQRMAAFDRVLATFRL
jgi:peroxidase